VSAALLPDAARAPARSAARTLARLAWRLLRAERAPRLLLLVLVLAVAYAARGGRGWLARERATRAAALAADRGRLDSLRATLAARAADTTPVAPFGDPRNPYAVGNAMGRRWVTLPALPLAPVAGGQSDLFPAYHRVSMFSRETLLADEELENPAHLLAGRFDLAFVVVFLYPLLVVALAYNALALERERGTLRLLLAQPVRARTVLVAKVATRAGALTAAAAALVVGGALLAGVDAGAPGAWPALALAALVTAAYGLVWFALALVVNAAGRGSSANALALLGGWLAAVVLVPALLAAAVGAWAPAPSRVTLVQAQRDAGDAANARAAQVLAAFMQDHPELAPAGRPVDARNAALRNLAVQDDVAAATAPVRAAYDAALDRQQRAAARWRFLSPALVAHDGLTTLAGTDAARYRRFGREADAYARTLRDHYAPMIARGERFAAADVARIPAFAWREAPAAARTRRAAVDAAALLAAAAALGALALALLARRPLAVD
jgi:ABC-2 type transport system permease protein